MLVLSPATFAGEGSGGDCGGGGGEVDAVGVVVATEVLRNPKLQTGFLLRVKSLSKTSLP